VTLSAPSQGSGNWYNSAALKV